jgi:hypothetical protein
LNSGDIKLYKRVCHQFDIRQNLYSQGHPFTYGFMQEREDKIIRGCAYQRDCDDPIEIDIYRKDEYLTTQLAKDHRPGLVNQGVPRKGFIGFAYRWENADFKAGEIRCVVRSSGQEIV